MPYGSGKYQYELIKDWAKLPQGSSFIDVGGISVDSKDNVYILNRSTKPIMIFDKDGNLLNSWGEGFFNRAHGSCIGPDNTIYCTDDRNHIVAKFSLDGKLLMQIGEKGKAQDNGYIRTFDFWESLGRIKKGVGPFNRPTGVALGPKGDIYVSDGYGNCMCHKFTSDGKLILSWGGPGGKPGQFRLPHDLKVDSKDRVWVVDRENHRIQIFDNKGKFLDAWTDFIRPTNLAIDEKNKVVYVSELSMRVQVLTLEGKLITMWGNTGLKKEEALFLAPHTIAYDSHGDLYVGEVSMTGMQVDKGANTVQKFRRI